MATKVVYLWRRHATREVRATYPRPTLLLSLLALGCGGSAPAPAAPTTEAAPDPSAPRAALRCDDLPETTPLYRIGETEGEITVLVPVRGAEPDAGVAGSFLRESDLNGDALPDYFDEVAQEGQPICDNYGECYTRGLVGCDDLVALVWRGEDVGDLRVADEGREVGGLTYRDIVFAKRIGGVAEMEAEDPFMHFRYRVSDELSYELVERTPDLAPEAAGEDVAENELVRTAAAWGSAPDDIFAVGDGILHFDGQSWTPMQITLREREMLSDVWGSGPADVYAVSRTRVLHYDGQRWAELETPPLPDRRLVWGSGANDVYILSRGGQGLRYDGAAFSPVLVPVSDVGDMSGRGPDDLHVCGAHGEMAHFDGSVWTLLEPLTSDHLTSVHAVGPRLAFATTGFSAVFRWNGRRWREDRGVPRASDGSDHGRSIWAAGPRSIFVAGEQSFVFVRDRRAWRRTNPTAPVHGEAYHVWGHGDAVYAFGSQARIFRFEGGEWTRVYGDDPEAY